MAITQLTNLNEITASDTFETNYLVQNGEIADELTLNRATSRLKSEINLLATEVENIQVGSVTLDSLNITATTTELNKLDGYLGTTNDLNILTEYSSKLQFLSNVNEDILALINSGGLGIDGLTVSTAALNWAGGLYGNGANSGITSGNISYLSGLSGNVESRLSTLESGGGTGDITETSVLFALTNVVNKTQLQWLANVYDQDISGSEMSYLNGVSSNIQQQFNDINSTISGLQAGSSGVTSVNGLTGAVTITASGIGAATTSHTHSEYATTSSLSSYALSSHTHTYSDINAGSKTFSNTATGTVGIGGSYPVYWPAGKYSSGGNYYGLIGVDHTQAQTYRVGTFVKSSGLAVTGATTGSKSTGTGVWGGASADGTGVIGVSQSGTGVKGEGLDYGFYTNSPCFFEGSTYPFTGSHFTLSNEDVMVGDIVLVTDVIEMGINNTLPYVETAKIAKSKKAFGVYNGKDKAVIDHFTYSGEFGEIDTTQESGTPLPIRKIKDSYISLAEQLTTDGYKMQGVNAIGEGMLNVCEANGNIENGDYITTSDVPGKGMKQTEEYLANFTVAKSLVDVDWSQEVVGQNGCFEFNGFKCKMIGCTYHCG